MPDTPPVATRPLSPDWDYFSDHEEARESSPTTTPPNTRCSSLAAVPAPDATSHILPPAPTFTTRAALSAPAVVSRPTPALSSSGVHSVSIEPKAESPYLLGSPAELVDSASAHIRGQSLRFGIFTPVNMDRFVGEACAQLLDNLARVGTVFPKRPDGYYGVRDLTHIDRDLQWYASRLLSEGRRRARAYLVAAQFELDYHAPYAEQLHRLSRKLERLRGDVSKQRCIGDPQTLDKLVANLPEAAALHEARQLLEDKVSLFPSDPRTQTA